MRQRRATIEEAEELLRWLQKQEAKGNRPPPYDAVVFGYITLHNNCADTGSDVLRFSPQIQEAFAALEREQAEAEGGRVKTIREWFNELPDGYRERALAAMTPGFAEVPERNMAGAIRGGIDWSSSDEGWEFWSAVCAHYEAPLPPLRKEGA